MAQAIGTGALPTSPRGLRREGERFCVTRRPDAATLGHMRPWLRPLLAVLGFALAMHVGLPLTEYICRYSGHRVVTCCCGADEQGSAPALKAACCCDVHVSLSSADPRVVEGRQSATSPPTTIAVVLSMPQHDVADTIVAAALMRAVVERPPDRGRDLYLRVRRLLI